MDSEIGSLPIADLQWLLASAVKFRFADFTVHKCSGWWEVYQQKEGFQKNPNHPDTERYCFTLEEAITFVRLRL